VIKLELLRRSTIADAVAASTGAAQGRTALSFQPATASAAAPSAPAPTFARTGRPTTDFEAVRAGVRTIVETTVVDLSVAHTLAAGTAVVLSIQGTAYFIDKGSDVGLATLHIQDQTNTPVNSISTFPGDANNNVPFTFMVIENAAQAGKVLRIHYGTDIQFLPGLGGNITFTGGMSILQTAAGSPQGQDVASFNNNAFGMSQVVAAVAAQLAFFGVENPAASGKLVYVDSIIVSTSVADDINIGGSAVGNGANSGVFASMRPGGANANAQARQGNSAGGALTSIVYKIPAMLVNTPFLFVLPRPMVIDQNRGCYVNAATVNTAIKGSMQIREY